MAEAIARLSLAANIAQFVDYAARLVSKAQELYHSASGLLEEDVELVEITADLDVLNRRILSSSGDSRLNESSGLCGFVDTCLQLSTQLRELIQSTGLGPGERRKWKSVKKSLHSLLRRNEVRDIESRLRRVREHICFHITVLLR
jgi:hypothetical protein